MLIDTHAHLNFNAFADDRDAVIKDCLKKGISAVNVGSNFFTSQKAVEIAEKYSGFWASIGLHPIHLASALQSDEDSDPTDELFFDEKKYKELAYNGKVVAIGETGLDYYYKPKSEVKKREYKKAQEQLLKQHLILAKELDKAVIMHCRMAYDDLLAFFEKNADLVPRRGVLHCYMAGLGYLPKFLELGFYLGYNGIIYKSIEGINFEDLIKNTPKERILLETDCPYLPPLDKKGERNTPEGVFSVLKTVAAIKKIPENILAEQCNSNAKTLFNL